MYKLNANKLQCQQYWNSLILMWEMISFAETKSPFRTRIWYQWWLLSWGGVDHCIICGNSNQTHFFFWTTDKPSFMRHTMMSLPFTKINIICCLFSPTLFFTYSSQTIKVELVPQHINKSKIENISGGPQIKSGHCICQNP